MWIYVNQQIALPVLAGWHVDFHNKGKYRVPYQVPEGLLCPLESPGYDRGDRAFVSPLLVVVGGGSAFSLSLGQFWYLTYEKVEILTTHELTATLV